MLANYHHVRKSREGPWLADSSRRCRFVQLSLGNKLKETIHHEKNTPYPLP